LPLRSCISHPRLQPPPSAWVDRTFWSLFRADWPRRGRGGYICRLCYPAAFLPKLRTKKAKTQIKTNQISEQLPLIIFTGSKARKINECFFHDCVRRFREGIRRSDRMVLLRATLAGTKQRREKRAREIIMSAANMTVTVHSFTISPHFFLSCLVLRGCGIKRFRPQTLGPQPRSSFFPRG